MLTGQLEFFDINVEKCVENSWIVGRLNRRAVLYERNEQHNTATGTPTNTALFFS